MRGAIDSVRELITSGFEIGEPRTHGALTLVPLRGAAPGPSRYLIAADAFAAGSLTIAEMGDGAVPMLIAKNAGDLPVLLVAGEHLEGAKQNRTLNASVLLSAKVDTVIPVTCVEQGRWRFAGGRTMTSSPHLSHARLRSRKTELVGAAMRAGRGHVSDQGAEWREVAVALGDHGVTSPTGAMSDMFVARGEGIDRMLSHFAGPEPAQTGVAACIDGKVVAVDAFDRPETLAGLWSRLVSGYAIDALGRPETAADGTAARGFLTAVEDAAYTDHEGIGLGRDVVITASRAVGAALAWERGVVHLALFSRAERPDSEPRPAMQIDPPRVRRWSRPWSSSQN